MEIFSKDRKSNCCGAGVAYDSDICSDCKEHCALECDECDGSGEIFDRSKSVEMRIDPPTRPCPKCYGSGELDPNG